jgi:hypothetical protein
MRGYKKIINLITLSLALSHQGRGNVRRDRIHQVQPNTILKAVIPAKAGIHAALGFWIMLE